MAKRKTQATSWLVAGFLFLSTSLYLGQVHRKAADSEPDQYLHFALGRQMAEGGVIQKIPQVEDLSWSQRFNNDYFLFTALVAGGWKIAGEPGARAVVPLLSLVLMLLIFAFCRRYVHWGWAAALTLFLLFNPSTLSRMISLRPALLAECLFMGLALGIVTGNRWAVGLCAFFFPLSYHAIYFPAFALGIAAVLGRFYSKDWTRLAGIGAAGLLVGTVIHPGFPYSLEMVGNVFQTILKPVPIPLSETSTEAQAWGKEMFLGRMPFCVAILAIALWQLSMEWVPTKGRKRASKVFWEPEFLFIFSLTAVFAALIFLSYRAIEYAGPLSLVFAALVIGRTARGTKETAALVGLGFVFLLPEAPRILVQSFQVYVEAGDLRRAIEAIPAEANGKKVYNCDWFAGGPLLYWKPQVRFVDLGDPGAIDGVHPGFASLKASLRMGESPYALGPVRFAFQSDYVLCQHSPLVDAMEFSPHFRRIFPSTETAYSAFTPTTFTVYEASRGLHPSFVSQFEMARSRGVASHWEKLEGKSPLPLEQRSPFLGLGQQMEEGRGPTSEGPECVDVRPSVQEIAKNVGANYLALGGGPAIEVEFNGKKIFHREKWRRLRDLDTVIPLPRPLESKDAITIQVCKPKGAARSGIAVSFWTRKNLEAVCHWKGQPLPKPHQLSYSDMPTMTCLGPLAARVE